MNGHIALHRRIAHRSLARCVTSSLAVLLVAATVLPAANAATAATPTPQAPGSGPEAELVPGVAPGPAQPWQIDTPDQVLPPKVYTPSAKEDAVEPRDAPRGTYDLIEYVPLTDAVAKVACSRQAGPYQRQVERWLKRKADGKQSAADCKAIRAFQKKHKIKPATGFAGPVTWAQMMLLSARKNPNAAKKCPIRTYRVACVDLDRQVTWVQKGGKVVFGPVSMRSGRKGHTTRGGWHTVYWRHKNHWSTLYNSPMPYAQFFDGGQAFHAVYGSIYTTVGSWGCVNLKLADARKLWGVLKKGDRVFVWGRRSGS
ncbi:L,D-transpeptidase family protein [Streptomyces sp. NPDC005209]|uniref:L,D-transpeptidase family protein n=1 Tax=Streptomyces sp. NPDC005209 TaxID=3156715 RepID=UPI0033AE7B2E